MAGFFDNTLVPFKGKKIKKPKYLFEKFILKIRKKKPYLFYCTLFCLVFLSCKAGNCYRTMAEVKEVILWVASQAHLEQLFNKNIY